MLTFNGRDIIWYAVYYNNPNNRGTICYFCCSLSIVPTITVQASIRTPATSSFIAGQSYSFTCDGFVTVDGTLSVNTTVTWIRPNGIVTSRTGRTLGLTLNPLQESDAGQYTCNASVSSPLLAGAHVSTDTFTINILCKMFVCECVHYTCWILRHPMRGDTLLIGNYYGT